MGSTQYSILDEWKRFRERREGNHAVAIHEPLVMV